MGANYRKQFAEGEIEAGTLLDLIDRQAAEIAKLAAWKAAVEAPGPADVQVRVNNPLCTWQRPDTTRDEPTPLARAQYLCDNWPKQYSMRLLYTLPLET